MNPNPSRSVFLKYSSSAPGLEPGEERHRRAGEQNQPESGLEYSRKRGVDAFEYAGELSRRGIHPVVGLVNQPGVHLRRMVYRHGGLVETPVRQGDENRGSIVIDVELFERQLERKFADSSVPFIAGGVDGQAGPGFKVSPDGQPAAGYPQNQDYGQPQMGAGHPEAVAAEIPDVLDSA